MPHERWRWRRLWLLAASVLLVACGGAPRRYAIDTVSNACRQSPVQCAGLYGSEGARAKAQTEAVASAGIRLATVQRALDMATRARIVEVLEKCANEARSEVLERRMGGRSPTPEECMEKVGANARGEPVTRAMKLGEEMHEFARGCAEEGLGEFLAGRFSLEQRYRYDRQSGRTTLVAREEEAALLSRGLARELLGTLKPDVVIHSGNPLHALAVYDFKFPCIGGGDTPWRMYSPGHPHALRNQKQVYQQALKLQEKDVQRILPHWGAMP